MPIRTLTFLGFTSSSPLSLLLYHPVMAVVGAGPQAPASKKALAAAKKLASLPALPSSRGVDPTLTVVEKKVVVSILSPVDGSG
jgi:hypothetical protein